MEGNFLDWNMDEITNPQAEEAPANVVAFTLQAEVAVPVPEREATPGVRTQAPPTMEESPSSWRASKDEARRVRSFHRSWHGTSRLEWNSNPIHSDGEECSTCGYKWHPIDIMEGGSCYNCWMIDNKPDEVAKFWRQVYASDGKKHGETAAPKLVKL